MGVGAVRLLEVIWECDPDIRFYQASTGEMFGKAQACASRSQRSKLLAHLRQDNPYQWFVGVGYVV
jgi:GDP-D-mannose dehydratase